MTRNRTEMEAITPFTYREITGHAFARYATHLMHKGVKEEATRKHLPRRVPPTIKPTCHDFIKV